MTDVRDPEVAVRSYLLFLEDPAKLIDPKQVRELEKVAEAATDPIDRLRALAEVRKAKHVSADQYERAFIRHAKHWASANDIPGEVFKDLGVADSTLAAAGLSAAGAGQVAGAKRRTPRTRVGSVTAEQIKSYIATLKTPFLLSDIVAGVGGSPMTIRKALGELISAGTITNLGPDPTHQGRGRSPIRYSPATRTAASRQISSRGRRKVRAPS